MWKNRLSKNGVPNFQPIFSPILLGIFSAVLKNLLFKIKIWVVFSPILHNLVFLIFTFLSKMLVKLSPKGKNPIMYI